MIQFYSIIGHENVEFLFCEERVYFVFNQLETPIVLGLLKDKNGAFSGLLKQYNFKTFLNSDANSL